MARKSRIEIEGGLYHVITRGNNRQQIFNGVDVDPVLRHFGGKRKLARERYQEFVLAGMKLGHQAEFYRAEEGRILGGEEFVDATIHRLGETKRPRQASAAGGAGESFDAEGS